MTHLYRQPMYMEQLIPPSAVEEYGIRTRTPLSPLAPVPSAIPPLYVPETVEALRAVMTAMDLKPKVCQTQNSAEEIRINKARIQEGREVIFVNSEKIPPYAPVKKFVLKRKA